MAARKAMSKGPAWLKPLKDWAYSKSYFPQLGLMIDDCLPKDKYVIEALKRLPKHVREERDFRLSRALLLSYNKEILPKEEWTKRENDVKYLTPIIEEVKKEMDERWEWNSK